MSDFSLPYYFYILLPFVLHFSDFFYFYQFFFVAFISPVVKFLNVCWKLHVYYTCVNGKYYGSPQTSSLCSASWV